MGDGTLHCDLFYHQFPTYIQTNILCPLCTILSVESKLNMHPTIWEVDCSSNINELSLICEPLPKQSQTINLLPDDEVVYLGVPARLGVLGEVPQPRPQPPQERVAKVLLLDPLKVQDGW